MKKNKKIMAWVIQELQQNGPQSSADLCKKCLDIFPEINYDTIRTAVYKAGKTGGIGRTLDGKFVYMECCKRDTP